MPESSSSPVCGSRRRRSVGSSSARRRSACATLSSSPFVFAVTAKLITGSGKPSAGGSRSCSASTSTSPVCTSFSFATAPRSPAPKPSAFSCSLPSQRHQRAEPLLRVVAVVDERRVGLHLAGIDAEDRDAAGERVGDRLEDEGRDRRVGLDRRALLGRARDALDDQVEQRMAAEVLRRDAARDRVDLVAGDGVLERGRDVLGRDLLAAEVALHQRLVGLDDGVEQLRAVLLDGGRELGRDRDRVALARAGRIDVRAVVQQVDDAGQLVLGADRQLDRDAAVGQLLLQRCRVRGRSRRARGRAC